MCFPPHFQKCSFKPFLGRTVRTIKVHSEMSKGFHDIGIMVKAFEIAGYDEATLKSKFGAEERKGRRSSYGIEGGKMNGKCYFR